MKIINLLAIFLFLSAFAFGQNTVVKSPNNKVEVVLSNVSNSTAGSWSLRVNYDGGDKQYEVIPQIDLGLSRSDQDFSNELKFLKIT